MSTAAALLRAQITDIHAQITTLRQQIVFLEGQQAGLHARLMETKYPILTLPEDVTIYIWAFVLGSQESNLDSRTLPSLTLSSVCRTWRQLALSTTMLWTDMTVSWASLSSAQCNTLLWTFLGRCGSAKPLDVHFHFIEEDTSSLAEAFATLSSGADRLRKIRLSNDQLFSSLDCLPELLPMLETLDLGTFLPRAHLGQVKSRFTPRLRSLNTISAKAPFTLGLSLDNLAKLVISSSDPSVQQVVALLRHTPRLEILHLKIFNDIARASDIPCPLSCLRELRCTSDVSTHVLKYLTLPALQDVTFSYIVDRGSRAIEDCMLRSKIMSLRCLTLSHIRFMFIRSIVASMPPMLAKLTLADLPWDYLETREFCQEVRRGAWFPGLAALVVDRWYLENPSLETVRLWVETVITRWGSAVPDSESWSSPESPPDGNESDSDESSKTPQPAAAAQLQSFQLGILQEDADSDLRALLKPLNQVHKQGLDLKISLNAEKLSDQ
ncbi:MYND-type domain-containing protein [Mycena indigotica]|uniref:MYND-type domain-containing protein n=1 Tax=Mycena indigotica TaxID=2126181 RepID=A0A8H6W2I1_9AGAR|nr:MYND-type domain-containing protein [Mycena indigotica]KAF7296979.1 MYND-type domain-containing protein [Mycena indigotica]